MGNRILWITSKFYQHTVIDRQDKIVYTTNVTIL